MDSRLRGNDEKEVFAKMRMLILLTAVVLLAACTQAIQGETTGSNATPTSPPDASTPTPDLPSPTPTPPEPAVREAQRRIATPGGIGEVVPGFGGFFLDAQDNSIAYVYMLDTTQQALAEEAARIMLGRERFDREIREVRVLQAQYSIGQLGEWYALVSSSVHSVKGLVSTDLNEGENRIALRFVARPGVRQEVEALLDSLGIPREAIIIEVGCTNVGLPYQPPPMPDDSVLQSLKVWVEAPSEVRVGEPVQFILKVKNVAWRILNIDYGDPPTPNFVVTRPDGTLVWSVWCERGIIAGVGRMLTLVPGEVVEFNWRWQQWDGQGGPVLPGAYLVYGVFDTYPEVPAEPVTFRIAP